MLEYPLLLGMRLASHLVVASRGNSGSQMTKIITALTTSHDSSRAFPESCAASESRNERSSAIATAFYGKTKAHIAPPQRCQPHRSAAPRILTAIGAAERNEMELARET